MKMLKTLPLFLAAFMLLAVNFTMVAAQAPEQPHSFYGTVKVNGANVPDGTVVRASINGENKAQATTQTYQGNSVYSMSVSEGVSGATVEFQVNGVLANETATWEVGGNDELNLTVDDAPESVEANFTCTPTSGQAPLQITCTDASTGDNITAWSWEFGDGTTSSEQNPTHTYDAEGTYSVTLTVTDANGSDTESKSDYISLSSGPILSTTLQVKPSNVELYVGQSISLTLAIEESQDLYGLEVTCTTDAAVLPFQDAAFADFFDSDVLEGINELTQNSWHGALSQKNPAPALSGNGDFATLTVNAITTGTLEVHCTTKASDENGFAQSISALHSTITILEPPIGISGLSTYQSRETHAGIQVSATGPTNQITGTLETGRFEFLQLPFGSYQIKAETPGHLYSCIDNVQGSPGEATVLDPTKLLAGDVDGDHKINIYDATAVTDIFGQAPASKPTDFNADGIVDIFDLAPLGRNLTQSRRDSDNNPICTGW